MQSIVSETVLTRQSGQKHIAHLSASGLPEFVLGEWQMTFDSWFVSLSGIMKPEQVQPILQQSEQMHR